MAAVAGQLELTSEWTGLSGYLIASFYEVDSKGVMVEGSKVVKAPLTEANLDATLNWQSPFEQMGPESKAPTLFAMLQSGALQPIADALTKGVGQGDAQKKSTDFLKQFEGRTGITKLNSVQVFSGMPPIKISVTALFRAWQTPASEVEAPVNQLMAWALPKNLANNSTLFSRAVDALKGGDTTALDVLLPSQAPTLIGMRYKNHTYAPLVIESIGLPINSPVNSGGEYLEMLIPMTLCTLTALDKQDWAAWSSS